MANIRIAGFIDYISKRVTFIIRDVDAITGVSMGAITNSTVPPPNSSYQQMSNASDGLGGRQVSINLAGLTPSELAPKYFWYKDDLIEAKFHTLSPISPPTLAENVMNILGWETRGVNASSIGLYKKQIPITTYQGFAMNNQYLPFQIRNGSKTSIGTSSDKFSNNAYPPDISNYDGLNDFRIKPALGSEVNIGNAFFKMERAQHLTVALQSKTDVTVFGGSDGTINLNVPWSASYATPTYLWSDGATTKNRTGLSLGSYTVTVTVAETTINGTYKEQVRTLTVTISQPPEEPSYNPLDAVISGTNLTANGSNDGTALVTASEGSGNYSYAWADSAATTANRSGLAAGPYECTVTDLITTEVVIVSITLTEPEPEPIEEPPLYLEIPSMQSLHFSIEESVDNCSIFQTLDNKLFSNQVHPMFLGMDYCQKKTLCDFFNIQVRSSTDNLIIRLHDSKDDSVKDTYSPELILEALEREETYTVRLQDNGSSQTRVYFAGSNIFPFPLSEGDLFSLINSPFGDGNYEIISLNVDITTGQQYFVITLDYAVSSSNPSETAEAKFIIDLLPFNIYEFRVDFSAIFIGNYYISITASNNDGSETISAKSEPISLKTEHENSVIIEWANIDNSYDIDYSNNIVHRIRLDSIMFERLPASDRDGFRTLDGEYSLLSANPQRKVKASFYNIPPYLQEKLAIIMDSDIKRINGMKFTCEDGLDEPEYIQQFGLSSSSAILEFKWFSTYNKNNIGGVNTPSQAFIDTQLGLIKR